MKNAQYTIYRLKNMQSGGNLVWNILQNFHEDRLIIQERSKYFMFFDIMTILIRMVVALTQCGSHLVGCRFLGRAISALLFGCRPFGAGQLGADNR